MENCNNPTTTTTTAAVDEAERRFLEDLEKAKALSLEMVALEKFKQEKLRESSATLVQQTSREASPIYARVEMRRVSESSRSPSVESTSPRAQIKPRPRPGGVSTSGPTGLVPPPLPKRQPNCLLNSNDLINLKSPTRTKNQASEDDDAAFLQELDLACPNLNISRSSRQGFFTTSASNTNHMQQTTANTNKLFSLPPALPQLNNRRVMMPNSLDESLLNQNLIDLAVDSTHPRYSILCAFDPLLSSSQNPVSSSSSSSQDYQSDSSSIIVRREKSITTTTKTEEFLFNQDYDPFEYFLGMSQKLTDSSDSPMAPALPIRETIYEVLTKEQSPVKGPAASSKRQSGTITSVVLPLGQKRLQETSLNIVVNQVNAASGDFELTTFVNLVRQIRSRFHHDEQTTNAGFVVRTLLLFVSTAENILMIFV